MCQLYVKSYTTPCSLLSFSKLPRRTLAELLAPSSVMVGRKFELRVDEWRFVGHPFSLQTDMWSASFNVVFVLQVSIYLVASMV